jgi:hypothetical protein
MAKDQVEARQIVKDRAADHMVKVRAEVMAKDQVEDLQIVKDRIETRQAAVAIKKILVKIKDQLVEQIEA